MLSEALQWKYDGRLCLGPRQIKPHIFKNFIIAHTKANFWEKKCFFPSLVTLNQYEPGIKFVLTGVIWLEKYLWNIKHWDLEHRTGNAYWTGIYLIWLINGNVTYSSLMEVTRGKFRILRVNIINELIYIKKKKTGLKKQSGISFLKHREHRKIFSNLDSFYNLFCY